MNAKEKTPKNLYVKRGIPREYYNSDSFMDLDNNYTMTVEELGLQQSKRDQIIAFYLTLLSFVIPNIIELKLVSAENVEKTYAGAFAIADVEAIAKAFAFLMLYIIGLILTYVIMRYRVYKEVYWIACRVLTQLCNIKKENINQSTIYTLYYNALKKNQDSIVKKNKKGHLDKDGYIKTSILRSFRRQLDSAETLLFETLVLFSTFVGAIGAIYLYKSYRTSSIIILLFLFCMFIRVNYQYTTKLIALYRCIDTGLVEDLEKTFKKAWMLHCYIDDITYDDNAAVSEIINS